MAVKTNRRLNNIDAPDSDVDIEVDMTYGFLTEDEKKNYKQIAKNERIEYQN